MNRKLLLLNGSPRKGGTSYSFARTMKMIAGDAGHTAEIIHVIDHFNRKDGFDRIKAMVEESDIIASIAPLYVDALPYPAIRFFEELAGRYSAELSGKDFFAVAQSGFIDIVVMQSMLETCRFFAEETGMRWLGGLAYGGGAIIDGARLEDLGRKGRRLTTALQIALEDVFAGRKISDKAQNIMTEKFPKMLYRPLAAFLTLRVKMNCRKNKITFAELCGKPYLE